MTVVLTVYVVALKAVPSVENHLAVDFPDSWRLARTLVVAQYGPSVDFGI